MRLLSESQERWDATFAQNTKISDLRTAVRSNSGENPCNVGLRSVCWKAFLLFENLDRSTWLKTLWDSRNAYTSLRDHFLRDIEHPDDLSATDPLTDDENSPWNTLRRDEILRAEIFQDIERCMPENLYFREPSTQSILLDVLFIFCKLNADIGYRQGMHEILAPILWVVSRDAIESSSLEADKRGDNELHKVTLDCQYIEHDTFALFCTVMQSVKPFYELRIGGYQKSNTSNPPIVERSKRIHESYLRKVDPELTDHLNLIEILPQIFLIRWIRLLFGREFPFDDVLSLWDVLFAEDTNLDLVDFVCVAMLLRIRWQLLEADYSSALTLLLRYPAPTDPHGPSGFVGDALYIRQNLTLDGGELIISRYSGRHRKSHIYENRISSPNVFRFPRKSRKAISREGSISSIADIQIRSPSKFLQDQGGIEGILQEAARGVYSRGEKWGVAKALRGAVQGLQSGGNSPRRSLDVTRPHVDDTNTPAAAAAQLTARIKTLELRNKALAKMLESAMEELWVQQKDFEKQKAEESANALSLAIAKVQFVQVYLEDSSLPLLPDEVPLTSEEETRQSDAQTSVVKVLPDTEKEKPAEISSRTSIPVSQPQEPPSSRPTPLPEGNVKSDRPEAPTPSTKSPQSPTSNSKPAAVIGPTPLNAPRPSLAQSSFSWMLGDNSGRKSSFVSASRFPPEKKREMRGRAAFLFGEEDTGGKERRGSRDGMKGKGADEVGIGEDEEDGEGFTLGTLRGGRARG